MSMGKWNIEYWLSESQLNGIDYSDYWNNEEIERNKEWNIADGNFSRMENYLAKTGLVQDLGRCIDILGTEFNRQLNGTGIDLAAGNLWAAKYLLNPVNVDKFYCLEYSKHRLLEIGPQVLEHYNIPKENIILVLGSFYDLHLRDSSLDFVFLSQAFHHASNPHKLLAEIHRVLKQDGVCIIIGEHLVDYKRAYIRHLAKFIISAIMPKGMQKRCFGKAYDKTLIPKTSQLIPADPVLGDHYYTGKDYKNIFSEHGFKMKQLKNRNSQFQSFILLKENMGEPKHA